MPTAQSIHHGSDDEKQAFVKNGGKCRSFAAKFAIATVTFTAAILTMITFAHVSLTTLLLFCPFTYVGLFHVYDYGVRTLFDFFYSWCVCYFQYIGGVRIYEYGDSIPVQVSNEKSIMMGNHASWIDVTVLNIWFWKKKLIGAVNWVAFEKMKKVPVVFAGWLKGDALIACDWKKDIYTMGDCFKVFRQSALSRAFFLFPEGAVMLKKWKEKSDNYCKENKLPIFEHLLYPRTTGFLFFMKEVRKYGGPKYIYDYTLFYEGWGTPSPAFVDPFKPSSSERAVHIHTKIFNIDELPTSDEELIKWLENLYAEKDDLLKYFKAHGTFPSEKGENGGKKSVGLPGLKGFFYSAGWLGFAYYTTTLLYGVVSSTFSSVFNVLMA